MQYSQYRFHIFLNATHAIYIDGVLGQAHPHTWEITISAIKEQEKFVQFHEVEKALEDFLTEYQDKFLNEFAPFDTTNPTLENLTEYFLDRMQRILNNLGWMIFCIEVGETPTRSYIISLVENSVEDTLRDKNAVHDIIQEAFQNDNP